MSCQTLLPIAIVLLAFMPLPFHLCDRDDQDLGCGLSVKVVCQFIRLLVLQDLLIVWEDDGLIGETGVLQGPWYLLGWSLGGRFKGLNKRKQNIEG